MALPKQCGLRPPVNNIEGLLSAAAMDGMFGLSKSTEEERKRSIWLVRCLTKAHRHYDAARNLVLDQLHPQRLANRQLPAGAAALPILDFHFEMEDCITSLYKVVELLKKLSKAEPGQQRLFSAPQKALETLASMRNLQEHMHSQVMSGQTGPGPVLVTLDEDGTTLQLRRVRMPVAMLDELLDAAYQSAARLYPGFDASSPPTSGGPMVLLMTATIEIVPGEPDTGVSNT